MGMKDMMKQGLILYTTGLAGGAFGAVGSAYITTNIVAEKFKQDYTPIVATIGQDYNQDGVDDISLLLGNGEEVPLYTFYDGQQNEFYFIPEHTLKVLDEADKVPRYVRRKELEKIIGD